MKPCLYLIFIVIHYSLLSMNKETKIITYDNKVITFNKQLLQNTSFGKLYGDNLPRTFHMPNIPHTYESIKIFKQCLLLLHEKNHLYFKQIIKNAPIEYLYDLINLSNYFDVQSIYMLTRNCWINKSIDQKALSSLHTNHVKDEMSAYQFARDVSNDMSQQIIKKIIPYLMMQQIKKSNNISNTILLNTVDKKQSGFNALAINKNESILAAASKDNNIYILKLNKNYGFKLLDTNQHNKEVTTIAFHPQKKYLLASGSEDNTIRIWNLKTRRCKYVINGYTHGIRFLKFSSNGKLLASSADTSVDIWDMDTMLRKHSITINYDDTLKLDFVDNDTKIIIASVDGTINYIDITNNDLPSQKSIEPSFGELALNDQKTILATDTKKNHLYVYNMQTNTKKILHGHTGFVRSLFFYSDTILCSASDDQTIRFWDLNANSCIKILKGHNYPVLFIRPSKDKTIMYSASTDGSVRSWQLIKEEEYNILNYLHKNISLPLARLIYLAYSYDINNKKLDISNYPHLKEILYSIENKKTHNTSLQVGQFICKYLSINTDQKKKTTKG